MGMPKMGWAVRAWGSPDTRPIVLLHGFMQDAESWTNAAQSLSQHYYVVAPTMAPADAEEATLGGLAEGALGAAQQAMLHTGCRHVVLVGYSMGGRVALEYARRFAPTLDALILESAGLGPEDEAERTAFRQRNEALVERLHSQDGMDSFVDYWENLPVFESQKSLPFSVQQLQREHRLARDRDQLVLMLENAGAQTMVDAEGNRRMLADLDVPTLYLAGRHDKRYAKIAESLQGSCKTDILDSNHNIHLESPTAFTESVLAFLREAGIGEER